MRKLIVALFVVALVVLPSPSEATGCQGWSKIAA